MVLMNLYVGQQQRCWHREQTVGSVGAGERGMNLESSTTTDTIPYAKGIASGTAGWRRELNLVLCDNLEGWGGEVGRFKMEGTYVYLQLIHAGVEQEPTRCKAIIFQLKVSKLKRNKQKKWPDNN